MGGEKSKPDKQEENRDERGQFVPGQSGNPGGRPKKGLSLVAILRRKLNEKLAEGDGTRADEIMEALLEKGQGGDAKLLIELLNRFDGKVPDKQIHMGDMGAPVAIANMDEAQLRAFVGAGTEEEDDDEGHGR